MHDVLQAICEKKHAHVAAQKQSVSHANLIKMAEKETPARGFANALLSKAKTKHIGLIAEIKKASPSRGIIRADFNPEQLAKSYENAGATCLSVLTDTPYFQSDDAYLKSARAAVNLPVLRKDFMVDSYQIAESRALGADAILLIMAALSDKQAQEFEHAATELGMDALIEVHDEDELERALTHLTSPLIGINNRNLKTLIVDLSTSIRLRALVPANRLVICESGITNHADITRMKSHDIHCFLVGESLMLQADVTRATQLLLGAPTD